MGLWSLSPDNDDRKPKNRNSHPLLSLPHGCWVRNENPQASSGKDDLFAESGLSFLPPPWHEDSSPKRMGVKTELEVYTEQWGSFPHICQNTDSVWWAAQTSVLRGHLHAADVCKHLRLKIRSNAAVSHRGKHIFCEWIPLTRSVLLNSESPDFLHKYTSSISLSSSYTSSKSWKSN